MKVFLLLLAAAMAPAYDGIHGVPARCGKSLCSGSREDRSLRGKTHVLSSASTGGAVEYNEQNRNYRRYTSNRFEEYCPAKDTWVSDKDKVKDHEGRAGRYADGRKYPEISFVSNHVPRTALRSLR